MQSIISNIQSQSALLPSDKIQAPEGASAEGRGREKSQSTEGGAAAGVFLRYSPGKNESCCERHGDVEAAEQGAGSGVSVLLEAVQSRTAKCASTSIENVGNGLKSMEKSLKELEVLAKTLRRHKVIALPTLLWGTESHGNPDSLESIAIR